MPATPLREDTLRRHPRRRAWPLDVDAATHEPRALPTVNCLTAQRHQLRPRPPGTQRAVEPDVEPDRSSWQTQPVLFKQGFWPGLADGTITVAFRRWRRPTVKAGGTLQSPGGVLGIDEIVIIQPDELTDADARAAGYRTRREALADLRPDGDLYRIRFHRVGDDPRTALRHSDDLGPGDMTELRGALGRLGWAVPTLRLIAQCPGTVSTDLVASLGLERARFKQRVRRLKALGLTESLKFGYRLSPRGQAFLAGLDATE